MIFSDHKVILLHPGKTAGTAIEYAFGYTNENYSPHDLNWRVFKGWSWEYEIYVQHATADIVRRHTPDRMWQTYFKFATVRNPFDRLVSVYYYLHDDHRRIYGEFDEFIEKLPQILEKPKNGQHGTIYTPQYQYIYIDGKQVVDYVLRMESLAADFEKLCMLLQLDLELLRVNVNTSKQKPRIKSSQHYSAASADTVRELYRRDFELLGYSMDL